MIRVIGVALVFAGVAVMVRSVRSALAKHQALFT